MTTAIFQLTTRTKKGEVILAIPNELGLRILSLLDRISLTQCRVVCEAWREFAEKGILWEKECTILGIEIEEGTYQKVIKSIALCIQTKKQADKLLTEKKPNQPFLCSMSTDKGLASQHELDARWKRYQESIRKNFSDMKIAFNAALRLYRLDLEPIDTLQTMADYLLTNCKNATAWEEIGCEMVDQGKEQEALKILQKKLYIPYTVVNDSQLKLLTKLISSSKSLEQFFNLLKSFKSKPRNANPHFYQNFCSAFLNGAQTRKDVNMVEKALETFNNLLPSDVLLAVAWLMQHYETQGEPERAKTLRQNYSFLNQSIQTRSWRDHLPLPLSRIHQS